jgi:hypothetical protein
LVTRLKTIQLPTYETATGENVFLWRESPLEPDEVPGIYVFDTDDVSVDFSLAPSHARAEEHQLTVEIGLVATSTDEYRKIVRDVRKAIGVDETFGGLAMRTTPVRSTVAVDDAGVKILGIEMIIRVDYRTQKWAAE